MTYDAQMIDDIREAVEAELLPVDFASEYPDYTVEQLEEIVLQGRKDGWDSLKAGKSPAPEHLSNPVTEQRAAVSEALAQGAEQGEPVEVDASGSRRPPVKLSRDQENRERRRRKGGDMSLRQQNLVLDKTKLDPDFEYRWALDKPGRMMSLTQQDDWDIVTDAHAIAGQTGNVTAVAKHNGYNAGNHILVRKRKDYHEEDRAEFHASLRDGITHLQTEGKLQDASDLPAAMKQDTHVKSATIEFKEGT